MIPLRAHHVSFAVADLERSRSFYEGVLGLEEIERPDFGFSGAWYRAGDIELHLIVPPAGVDTGRPPPGLNPVANHMAFAVEDYVEVRDALKEKGAELLETDASVGQMWVHDPDGNIIELIVPGGRLGRPPRS